MVVPSTKSPWPEVPVYEKVFTLARITKGDEFAIGLDVNTGLRHSWQVSYDDSILSLEEHEIIYIEDSTRLGTSWFRFKAIAEANSSTELTFDLTDVGVLSGDNPLIRLRYGITVIQ